MGYDSSIFQRLKKVNSVWIEKRVPSFHTVLRFVLVLAIICQALLLSGCASSSPFGRTVYVASFRYNHQGALTEDGAPSAWQNVTLLINATTASTHFEVRASYFRICATTGNGWTCADTARHLSLTSFDADSDPLGVANLATRYRDEVLFPGLTIGSAILALIAILMLSTYPGWHEELDDDDSLIEVRPFPSGMVMGVILAAIALSAAFALISALWHHTSAATVAVLVEASAYGHVSASIGSASVILAWLSVVLLLLAGFGQLLTILVQRSLTAQDDF